MSADRVIPAMRVEHHRIESFPYSAARYTKMPAPGEEEEEESNDEPLGAALTTPEEDARRLASVDQVIFEKLQQAERDALDTARRGYEEGFASGEAEGRAFGESQYRAHIQRLDGQLKDLSQAIELGRQAAKEEILALALAVGQYLAGRELSEGTGTLAPLLDSILDAQPFPGDPGGAEGPAPMTVFMHPKDVEALQSAPDAPAPFPGVQLREDHELTRGSLRIEAAAGVLDASLEQRQARLLELVQRMRAEERP
jgi:flagellar biosynthesis/type III secretory pathway protein FliH